jgi:hypothetical protein
MRDFYIILAKLGWGWVALLAVIWLVVALGRRRRPNATDSANSGIGFEVQPTERHEEHR